MKLQTLRRGTAAGAVLALSLTMAACGGSDDEEATGTDTTSESAAPEETPSEDTPSEDTGGDDAFADVFGPACDQIPGSGDGSLDGMVDDPVATAASNNPLLGTLVTAVQAAGLDGTLNDAPALTVFAPVDDAFGAIPEDQLNDLLAGAEQDGPNSDLATILSHHVLGENLAPTQIGGEQTTLIGDNLEITGDAESGVVVSDGEVDANVLCGGIPTANATVYVIDAVLTNAMPANG